ncbi:hypothetical protein JNJ66_05220 [Candidatus Saccharibacteria bacterium]|nr:hypothetical protein [Candidatus Saccharibacteria bacterium]
MNTQRTWAEFIIPLYFDGTDPLLDAAIGNVRARVAQGRTDALQSPVLVGLGLDESPYSRSWLLCLVPLLDQSDSGLDCLSLMAWLEPPDEDGGDMRLRVSVDRPGDGTVMMETVPQSATPIVSGLLDELEAGLRPILMRLTERES